MKGWLPLAFVTLPLAVAAQERLLPEDLLLGGRTSDLLEAKQLSGTKYEFTRKVDMKGATPINVATFCAAAALAHMRGYASWTVGSPLEETPSSKGVLTVALLNSPAEMANLPATHKWLPYADMKRMRSTCTQFLQPKYLWPSE
jgi:hypothetical protein